MQQYGLIGYPLGHSFSKRYFEEKFAREGITDARYDLFPVSNIRQLPNLLKTHPDLCGLNVTIPYKQAVVPYLHDLDDTARAVGAVNTICIRDGRLTGFNTDVIGFEQTLYGWLPSNLLPTRGFRQLRYSLIDGPAEEPTLRAYIIGTGGAAKAVAHVLEKWELFYTFVSRSRKNREAISYRELNARSARDFDLIVNATPLGTYPDVDTCPPIPFNVLDERHLVYDLVYNPAETLLLRRAKARGATVKNGLEMLQLQAEAAWNIWQA